VLAVGLRFSVVLAARRFGESGPCLSARQRLGLPYVVALRSHHGVWLLPGQRLRQTRGRPCERVFPDGSSAQRFVRETISGTRHAVRSYQLTTDPAPLAPAPTWDLLTTLPGTIEQTVGTTFGLRTGMA